MPEAAKVGALGAALVAGVGVYDALDGAALRACRVVTRHASDPERQAAATRDFERNGALADALRRLEADPHARRRTC